MSRSSLSSARAQALRGLRIACVGTAAFVAGCSTMQDIPAGTSLSEVQSRYGSPTLECPLPDGSRRMVWSTQPMGQYAWATVVTPDERVGKVEQVLTDQAFKQVEIGTWDQERLTCAFGPPAESSVVGLPGSRQLVWSYRYRQAGAWNSLMHVYLSEDGRVLRMHPGPDPMFDPPEFMFF